LPIPRTPDTVYRIEVSRVTSETVALGACALHARRSGRQEGRTVAKSLETPVMPRKTPSPRPPTGLAAPTALSRPSPLTTRLLIKYQLRRTTKEEK
jgi:hypothetical protein